MITYHGKTEFYTSLGDRPPANSYGAGNCFVAGVEYFSNGVAWTTTAEQSGDLGAAALLTGLTSTTGTVAATDTIVLGISKIIGNVALKALNLLTGYTTGTTEATVAATDSVLQAFQKINGNVNLRAINLLTGMTTAAGSVAVTDTVTVGIGRLVGNVALKADILTPVFLSSTVPATILTAGTLDSATMLSGIIVTDTTTDENTALTLPTAAVLEAALAIATNNKWFEWTIINLGATTRTITLTAAATTHDIVGNAVVAVSTSARFRTVRVSSISYITYRVA